MHNTPRIHVAAQTHVGRVRPQNEDTVFADPALGLLAVADGLGGRNAGEIASRLAIDSLATSLPSLAASGHYAPPVVLQRAFSLANAHVFGMSTRIPGCAGMGTTLVAGWFIDTPELGCQLVVGHVGDSRLYRLRGTGPLVALTRDHSSAQALIDGGLYTVEAARHLPQRHILTNALGVAPEVDIDLLTVSLERDDLVLLCSDGLSNMLEHAALEGLITRHPRGRAADLQTLADTLIEAANEQGGHDNISVALATLAR